MKLCSQCHEREGVVHLTHIEGSEVRTSFLCAKCAAEKGIQTTAALADTPLGGFLAAMGEGGGTGGTHAAAPAAAPDKAGEATCPTCGATIQDFRETGRVGCTECYRTFEEPLRELLRRLHGSTHHTGTTYQPPGTPAEAIPGISTQELRDQLKRAIANEQFELAAELRDRLRDHE